MHSENKLYSVSVIPMLIYLTLIEVIEMSVSKMKKIYHKFPQQQNSNAC